jgi:acetolactate synthase-1/2/3 large subunit
MFAAQYYRFDEPRMFQTSGGLGTMGYSLPGAIGAQVARPDKEVWAIAGDGCFQMNLQELAVLTQERIPVKIAVVNNGYLGMVRQWQQLFWAGNYQHVDLSGTPDYVKLADAYGIPGWRVSAPGDLKAAIDAARAHPGPALVEFRVFREENVFPMVPSGAALSEVIPDTPYVPAAIPTPVPVATAAPAAPTPVHARGGSR